VRWWQAIGSDLFEKLPLVMPRRPHLRHFAVALVG
jgi:hypothetical protein